MKNWKNDPILVATEAILNDLKEFSCTALKSAVRRRLDGESSHRTSACRGESIKEAERIGVEYGEFYGLSPDEPWFGSETTDEEAREIRALLLLLFREVRS